MTILQKNIIKTLFCFGFISFLFMSSFGLSHFSMHMGIDGKMSMDDCPFMIGTSLCTMNPFEHISLWQSMFIALPHQNSVVLYVLLLSVFIFYHIYFRYLFSPPQNILSVTLSRLYQATFISTSYLHEAFSSGILNPKLF